MDLDTPLTYVKGVGPGRAEMLEAKGLKVVEDLLYYAPTRYEDRRNIKQIAHLAPGEMATVIASVATAQASAFRRRNLGMFEASFRDGSGPDLLGKWFHGSYLANVLHPGMRVALYGKVEWDSYARNLQILHPEFEILQPEDEDGDSSLHTGRIVPIYEATGKITTRVFRMLLRHILDNLPIQSDPLPEYLRSKLKLPERSAAMKALHFPDGSEDLRVLNSSRSSAHIRLIFEEFFWLECGLALKRAKARTVAGIAFELNDRVRDQIKKMLPFKPTGAQKRVLAEIAADMAKPTPMHRLLQGDVGSGKTLVAAEAAIIAMENGYQTAVLAPTEILAAQHFIYFKNLFQKLGQIPILLTGSTPARDKKQLKKLLAEGLVHLAIGTHALLEEDVEFRKLGFLIIDEQHRFGVMQRFALMQKGVRPDVLVMTATPIPRTLALTVYGDLDTSVIDEMPPGRKPIETRHVTEDKIEQVYSFLGGAVSQGRQAYVVYPLIEDSETLSMKAAQRMYEHLSGTVFPSLRLGLLHGKLKPAEKEEVMTSFKRGDIDILVATTVVEVGVDVANATVMVIEQAERFGLAQLHQLRGRVGRGGEQSYCILVTGKTGDAARERIRTLVESNDGFHLADVDLRLRGPGELFGTKQSGMPALRVANLVRDQELLEAARAEALAFIDHPPAPDLLKAAAAYIQTNWQRRYGLAQVG